MATTFREGGRTNPIFFLRSLEARVPKMLPFASRKCRDLCGCCHAHSNWRAALIKAEVKVSTKASIKIETSRDGNPCTIICMTHGRLDRVLRAPWAISPLCCLECMRESWVLEVQFAAYLIRRGGDGVLPM